MHTLLLILALSYFLILPVGWWFFSRRKRAILDDHSAVFLCIALTLLVGGALSVLNILHYLAS